MFDALVNIIDNCLNSFLADPINVGLSTLFFLLSLICMKRIHQQDASATSRGLFIYLHVFTLLFPIQFFFFSLACTATGDCSLRTTLTYAGQGTFLLSTLLVALVFPLLFIFAHKPTKIKSGHALFFLKQLAKKHHASLPAVYVLNVAKPVAFSFSLWQSALFFSVGLVDILSRKEWEAVLLHEFAHTKERATILKLASFFTSFSPFLRFTHLQQQLTREEKKADLFASTTQQTTKHLLSAKKKIRSYYLTCSRYS